MDEYGSSRSPALLAVDILEAAKAEEEKRSDSSAAPGYFR